MNKRRVVQNDEKAEDIEEIAFKAVEIVESGRTRVEGVVDTFVEKKHGEVEHFVTTPGSVSASLGVTLSKSFQSVSFNVTYTIPCYKENLDGTAEQAKRRVLEHISKELPSLQEFLDNIAAKK